MQVVIHHVVQVEVDIRKIDEMAANSYRRSPYLRSNEAFYVEPGAMIWPCAEGIDEEDETVAVVERSQNFRHLLQLRRRCLLRLPNLTSTHVSADRDDDYFAVWENCGVVVDVIGNVANLCTTNGVNSHCSVVLHHTHDAITEEEDPFWSRRSVEVAAPSIVSVVALFPSGALPILMSVVAVPAVKRLLSVLHLEAVLHSLIARPCVEAANMVGPQFHLGLSHTVQDAVGVAMFAADGGFDDDGAVSSK